MASPRRQALGIDIGLGALALAFGTLAGGVPLTPAAALVAGLGGLTFVVLLALAERVPILSLIDDAYPASIVLTGVAFLLLGVGLTLSQTALADPSATVLLGAGVGLCAYRSLFGVVYSVPERRLRQARLWGEPPDPRDGDDSP